MRRIAVLALALGAAGLLSACGKSEEPVMPSTQAAAPRLRRQARPPRIS